MPDCRFTSKSLVLPILALVLQAAILQAREPWTSSNVQGSPDPALPFKTERLFPNIRFNQPVDVQQVPGTKKWVVAEQKGYFYVIDPTSSAPAKTMVINMRQPSLFAILSFAFDPDFERNRFVYVMSSLRSGTRNGLRLQRFRCTKTEPRVIPNSGYTILAVDSKVHNGCAIKFGPDRCLYIGMGDGSMGSPADPTNAGQTIDNLRACVLRIDVSKSTPSQPYRIPPDNPFVGKPNARGEVWAFGLRNPWRMAFAPGTNDLWVGDVGWEMFETLHCVRRGSNAGWSIQEGSQPVYPDRKIGPAPITPPIIEHTHAEAASITGGVFYGGTQYKKLRGAYVYGDYVTGKIWGLRRQNDKNLWHQQIAETPLRVISFLQDTSKRLIVLDYAGGGLHQLIPNDQQESAEAFPRKLSETGLFASVKEHRPATGVEPFKINASMWEDGTQAEYFVAIPGSQSMTLKKPGGGFPKIWGSFPVGSVLVKTISAKTKANDNESLRRLETQILHYPGKKRRGSSQWFGYTYVWNEEGTDATLAPAAGDTIQYEVDDAEGNTLARTHQIASRTQCYGCHNSWTGYRLGFNYRQLARHSQSGASQASEFTRLASLGIVRTEDYNLRRMAPFVNPHDTSANLSARARSYLHINCAHCHQAGGGGSGEFDLRHELSLANSKLLTSAPTKGSFGIPNAKLIAPGDPSSSVLLYRMAKLGPGRMPHIGSQIVDRDGISLLRQWMDSLKPGSKQTPKLKLAKFRLNAKPESLDSQITESVTDTHDAMEVLDVVESGEMGAEQKRVVTAQLAKHRNLAIRDLFLGYGSGQTEATLGETVDEKQILSIEGDVARGRDLLLNQSTMSCKNCHQFGAGDELVGPNLSDIGKRLNREQLLESILQPSKTIDEKYRAYVVETVEGQVHTGVIFNETESAMNLRTADNKEIKITQEDVEFKRLAKQSLMPTSLWKNLTAQQLADIVEYLASLK